MDRSHRSCHFPRTPAPVSWWQVRHFALVLNMQTNLMQPCFQRLRVPATPFPETQGASGPNDSWNGGAGELLPEMLDNPGTTRGTKLCVLQTILFLFWSIMALDRCSTHRSIRGLCKSCLAIGQRAFPREVARSRNDSSHERTLVPPLPVYSPQNCRVSGPFYCADLC